jgi:hypothetical protein
MIDIGTSAGLHLLWDLYCYDYKLDRLYGDPTSAVRIESAFRGNNIPQISDGLPNIGSRFGIDLMPIRPEQEDEIRWLEALIWPEHNDRRKLFKNAVDLLEQERNKIELFEGDAADVIADVLARVPVGEVPCIFQTHVGRQLSTEAKKKLFAAVEDLGRIRKIYLLSARRQLHLDYFGPGHTRHWILANYEQHGRWVEWLTPSGLV